MIRDARAQHLPRSISEADPPAGSTAHLFAMDIGELLVMLRRNVRLILAVTAASVLAVTWLLRYEQPAYQSSAALRLADARLAVAGGFEQVGMEAETDPFLSELEVLRSRSLAGEVVDVEGLRLHVLEGPIGFAGVLHDAHVALDAPPDTLQLRFSGANVTLAGDGWTVQRPYGELLESPDGHLRLSVSKRISPDPVTLEVLHRDVAIDRLLESMIVSPRAPTDIVDVHYTATDPGVARRVLERVTTTFQGTNAERAQQQSRRRREFLEVQIARTDSTLMERQLALGRFREKAGLYSTRDRMQAEQASLTATELRRRELTAEARMHRSLLEALRGAGTSGSDERLHAMLGAPTIASNPLLDDLYAQLIEYQRERDALTTGSWASSASHPDVQRLSALISSTEERILSGITSHIASLDARIAAMADVQVSGTIGSQALPQTEAEEVRLVQQVETVRQMGDRLREEFQRAQVAEAVEVGQVEILDAATLPIETVNLSRALKVGIAMMLGLLLGCGGAVGRELLDSTVRRYGETATSFNLPQLGVIPRIEELEPAGRNLPWLPVGRRASTNRSAAVLAASPKRLVPAGTSLGDEAFRSLRTNLMFAAHAKGVRTLVVTSAFPQEGKSVTASRLARAFAQQGVRTLLVDGDLRRPTLHTIFGVPQEPGLSEMLRGRPFDLESIRCASNPSLHVLTAGSTAVDAAELLESERMRSIVAHTPEGIDLVIVDSPPLLSAADASALAAKSDAVLVVVRAGRTARGALRQAVHQLETVGARIAGVVLNDPDTKVSQYADYYGAYGYYAAHAELATAAPSSS